jgi:hypothetical protein
VAGEQQKSAVPRRRAPLLSTLRHHGQTLALLGIAAFTAGEVAVWLLTQGSGTTWATAAVVLRLLEAVLPLVLLLSLPGLRRVAALPGLAVKAGLMSIASSVSPFREMIGDEFVCWRFDGEAMSSCVFVLSYLLAGTFWAVSCLELYAFSSETTRSPPASVDPPTDLD